MAFNNKEVCKIAGVTERCLRHWTAMGLVTASASYKKGTIEKTRYNLRDILSISVIKQLRDKGFSLQKIRESVNRAKRIWGIDQPLAQLRVACLMEAVVFKKDGAYVEALSGQHVFSIAINEIRNAVGEKQIAPTERMLERQKEIFLKKVSEM